VFADTAGISFLIEPAGCRSNYWLNALVLDAAVADQRDDLLKSLNAAGIQARALWRPMHQLSMYANCPRADLSVTEDVCRRVINIPSSAHLSPEWAKYQDDCH